MRRSPDNGERVRSAVRDGREKSDGGTNTKKVIAFILAVLVLITPASAEHITERKGKGVERWLWEELSKHSPSDAVTAGVLAYFWRESQYQSDAVSGAATMQAEHGWDLCGWVRRKTDKGMEDGSSRQWFVETVRECGGYGLGQWHSLGYLKDLYRFARKHGTSIADAEMQCAFVFHSLRQDKKLWRRLKKCRDPEKAGRLIAIYYDGSDGYEYMGQKAGRLYEKYA